MRNYHLRHYPDNIGETLVGSINNFSCFVVIESNCRTDFCGPCGFACGRDHAGGDLI